jgi:predicted CopG family antitoxin
MVCNSFVQLCIYQDKWNSEEVTLTKKIRISEEAYNCLQKARLPGEEINETLLRLIERYKQIEFIKRQRQILKGDDFIRLDES